MLFIACSEHTETQQKEVAVTFIPTLPVDISFRGVADGMTANRLYYAIYEQGSNEAISSNLGEPMPFSESTILTLPLISGFTYDIVFWVQAERAPYTFHPEAGYVAIDWDNHLTGNDEQRDAFIFVRKGYQVNQSGQMMKTNLVICQTTVKQSQPFLHLFCPLRKMKHLNITSSLLVLFEQIIIVENKTAACSILDL